MKQPSKFVEHNQGGDRWYDLFSRGARDWLRHNEKVREAVTKQLPKLISGSDILGSSGNRTVRVPVKFLEHFRFRLRGPENQTGAGQGEAKAGDVLRQPSRQQGPGRGQGGNEEGGYQFVLELKVDDIVDWLWEELQLPNLQTKAGATEQDDYIREGWDRRGARSRLDRRRSMKESIKRRAVQGDSPAFTDDDLRYRQLVRRERPSTEAVVFFAMDVSSSMTERDRQLAKTFFFWVIQGLRRQYTHIEPVFVAHTVQAWEFNEEEFFKVSGTGGTVASTAFGMVSEIIADRYDPSRFNIYLFYASDGENFPEDREPARNNLAEIGKVANYMGYVETASSAQKTLATETAAIFKDVASRGAPAGSYALTGPDSVWDAIRGFFQEQAKDEAEG